MRGIADPSSLTCLFVFGGGMDETVREGHTNGRGEAEVSGRNTSSLPSPFFLPPPPLSLWKGVLRDEGKNLLLPPPPISEICNGSRDPSSSSSSSSSSLSFQLFFAASPPIFYELGRKAGGKLASLSFLVHRYCSPRRTHAGTARGPALAEREARLSDSLTAR